MGRDVQVTPRPRLGFTRAPGVGPGCAARSPGAALALARYECCCQCRFQRLLDTLLIMLRSNVNEINDLAQFALFHGLIHIYIDSIVGIRRRIDCASRGLDHFAETLYLDGERSASIANERQGVAIAPWGPLSQKL